MGAEHEIQGVLAEVRENEKFVWYSPRLEVKKIGTSLSLYAFPPSAHRGQIVTFSGRLIRNDTGAGVAGVTIKIYDSDLIDNDFMAQGLTDSGGWYSISWFAAPMDPFDKTSEIYAKFEGTIQFEE